jgi:hypothetical protein
MFPALAVAVRQLDITEAMQAKAVVASMSTAALAPMQLLLPRQMLFMALEVTEATAAEAEARAERESGGIMSILLLSRRTAAQKFHMAAPAKAEQEALALLATTAAQSSIIEVNYGRKLLLLLTFWG